jgi:hypothetical protein
MSYYIKIIQSLIYHSIKYKLSPKSNFIHAGLAAPFGTLGL